MVTRGLGGIDVPATRVIASILAARSAGIHDLASGAKDEPLLPGVRYAFLAATVTADPDHVVGHLVGDLMVRVASASGPTHAQAATRRTFGGVLHGEIQCHPEVYVAVRDVLTAPTPAA